MLSHAAQLASVDAPSQALCYGGRHHHCLGGIGKLVLAQRLLLGLYALGWLGMLLTRLAVPTRLPDLVE